MSQREQTDGKRGLGWLLAYFRIGCIGFGGGTALIPIIEREAVDRLHLLSKEEYDEDVLLASVTPGALPIEIAGANGQRFGGMKAAAAAAVAMGLPGVLMAVLLLSCMSTSGAGIMQQIQLAAIGITGFIFAMLIHYISGTLAWARGKKRLPLCLAISGGVLVLNCGSAACKVAGLVGLDASPIFNISTIDILMLMFFVLFYTGAEKRWLRIGVAAVVGLSYLACVCNAQLIESAAVCSGLQGLMIVLSIYGIITNHQGVKGANGRSVRALAREELFWFALLAVCSIPALIVFGEFLAYLVRGLFSSYISFGGGVAYLTVADSLFTGDVATAGKMATDQFYSEVVTVVNVVPGSILSKTLACVGYFLGYNETGSIWGGYAVAFAGFMISVVGSCSMIAFARWLLEKFQNLREFEMLKRWTKAIISGLLGSVMLSLLYTCLNIGATYELALPAVLVEMALFMALNIRAMRDPRVGTGTQVLATLAGSLAFGNLMLLL